MERLRDAVLIKYMEEDKKTKIKKRIVIDKGRKIEILSGIKSRRRIFVGFGGKRINKKGR